MNIQEMLATANDEQKKVLLETKERFDDELSKLPRSDGETLNDTVNMEYRKLAKKYQKIFNELMK